MELNEREFSDYTKAYQTEGLGADLITGTKKVINTLHNFISTEGTPFNKGIGEIFRRKKMMTNSSKGRAPNPDESKSTETQSEESMSIFNQERKEYFLEHLQESMLHHAAIRDRAEKLAVHMGISIGDAANQLKAHLVQEIQEAAKKRKGNPFDTEIGMRSHEKIPDPLSKPQGKSTPEQIKSDIVDRTMRRQMMKRPNLPESVSESFGRFINEYELVLSENNITEYDLDEATEYFIEEILPTRQQKIISEGVDLLLSEELTIEGFIEWLEEGLGVLKQAGKDMMKHDLPSAIESHADAAKKFGAEHPLVKKLKARVDSVVQTAANHQIKMKAV